MLKWKAASLWSIVAVEDVNRGISSSVHILIG